MPPAIWGESISDHKRRMRERILATAATLVAERGGANVPMSLLARRAGIARATLYTYFPDLQHVLRALVEYEVEQLDTALDRQLAGCADTAQRLSRYLVTVHDWALRQRRPRGQRQSLPPVAIATVHQPLARLRDRLAAILADGVADRTLPADIAPRPHADLVLRLLLDPLPGDPPTRPATRGQVLRFLHRALALPLPAHRPG
jgi:AcrR family transcriptional regulator